MTELIEMAEHGLHDEIIKLIQNEKINTILDIAAGQGALSDKLNHLYFSVTAADINKDNFKLYDVIEFLNLDLNKELSLNRKFDSILAIEIIEHLENPYKLIRDCNELLNDNGILVISTPNITNYKSRLSFLLFGRFNSFFPQDKLTSGHINPVPIWELEDILKNNGFKIESISTTKFNLNVYPKHSIKSIFLKIIFTFGLLLLPFIQNWGFNEYKNLKTGNVVIFKARKTGVNK